ncbi:hypothetical protein [Burkholderia sp. MSMB1826]|uniref:hypothetical protein n=1 Tax=Burkholderia sp. MSMB1826 TaxID=1637875 RepID=UPI0012E3DD64|nr:hypothetical protein [Burkholderia sp. MSMB1826]
MHARPRCQPHLPEHRYARLNRHRLRHGPGRRYVDRAIAIARTRFTAGAARQPFAFSRFHDLMHGIARAADACRLAERAAGMTRVARQSQPARTRRTAAVRPRSDTIERTSP